MSTRKSEKICATFSRIWLQSEHLGGKLEDRAIHQTLCVTEAHCTLAVISSRMTTTVGVRKKKPSQEDSRPEGVC